MQIKFILELNGSIERLFGKPQAKFVGEGTKHGLAKIIRSRTSLVKIHKRKKIFWLISEGGRSGILQALASRAFFLTYL